ncbi:hypothetical protein M6B38_314990 [Iris pallida]|uniref:Uncharacterized protein n=1 Tax=Iris pallida TaxID=29817 RepID=A0AAX6HFF8_IRIPA|nr:hypothetical protein M6B38_314990 [Iris pallida]
MNKYKKKEKEQIKMRTHPALNGGYGKRRVVDEVSWPNDGEVRGAVRPQQGGLRLGGAGSDRKIWALASRSNGEVWWLLNSGLTADHNDEDPVRKLRVRSTKVRQLKTRVARMTLRKWQRSIRWHWMPSAVAQLGTV